LTQHFWIVGTDTDVGKTFVTTYFMRYLQEKGKSIIPYKPVQTGINEENLENSSDTVFYQSFSKEPLRKEHMNSYSFKEPASPHYAAMLENTAISEDIILNQIECLKTLYEYVICEGAGGLYVPLKEKQYYFFLDLIRQSQLPVILVTRTTLGTLNHTLLSLEVLKYNGISIAGIVCNAFGGTELEMNNIHTIKEITSLPTLVIPKISEAAEFKEYYLKGKDSLERLLHT
jgi:dethiobiotin synthetase